MNEKQRLRHEAESEAQAKKDKEEAFKAVETFNDRLIEADRKQAAEAKAEIEVVAPSRQQTAREQTARERADERLAE